MIFYPKTNCLVFGPFLLKKKYRTYERIHRVNNEESYGINFYEKTYTHNYYTLEIKKYFNNTYKVLISQNSIASFNDIKYKVFNLIETSKDKDIINFYNSFLKGISL